MPISSGRRRPPRPVSVHSASANSNAITGPSLPGPPSGRLPCDRKQQGQPHNQGRATKVAPHNGLCKSDRNSCYHKTIKQTGPGWVSSGSSSSATAGIPPGGFKKSGSVSSFCGRSDPSGPDGAGSESVPITDTPRRRNSSSTNSSATSSSGTAVMRRNGGNIPAARKRPTSVRVESITSPPLSTPSTGVVNGDPYHKENNNGTSHGHQPSLSANNGNKGSPLSALGSPGAASAKSPPSSGVPRPVKGNFSSNIASNPLMNAHVKPTMSPDNLFIDISGVNCNVARVSPVRRQLHENELSGTKVVNGSNYRPRSSTSSTSTNSSADGNNNGGQCRAPFYDMTPSSGSHVYENVGPRINGRTTSSPSYSASGGQCSGRPLNPGALRDRQSQLSEPMTGSQFSGLSSALSGCKSLSERQRQRQAVVKDTPRAPIDSKGTKEALVAASRQVTSLASSSSSSSSPLAKDDNTLFTVKPKTLPQASSGSSTSSSHNGHESAESSNLKLRRQRNKSLPYNLFDSSAANYPSLRNLVTPPPNHSLPGSPRRSLRRKSQCSDFRDSSTSVCSIIYASEDPNLSLVRRLHIDISKSQEKAAYLSEQLKTSTEMVSAFENSLTAMTAKLRQAAHILDVKDKEIGGLSDLIQLLKGDCEAQAERERKRGGGETTRFKLQRKPKEKTFIVGNKEEKSPSWLRSPTKAFRSRYGSDEAAIKRKLLVSPLFSVPKTFSADAMVPFEGTGEDNETVRELRRQMGEKDKILTDMRLAALSTAHQVESTKDHISKTILEIAVLREEQLKLNCLTKVL